MDCLNEKKEMTVNRRGLGRRVPGLAADPASKYSTPNLSRRNIFLPSSLLLFLLRVSICGVAREKYLTGQLCMHVVRPSNDRASNPGHSQSQSVGKGAAIGRRETRRVPR